MSNIERIFRVAKSDVRLQTIINNYFQRIGYMQNFVDGLVFKEKKDDSPAFCLGLQAINIPLGFIFVSEGLLKVLTQEELKFLVLHEMGHIMKNHVVGASLIWLAKSWIIDLIADSVEVSQQVARQLLEGLKAFYVLVKRERTIEEKAKAKHELEADHYAVTVQDRKDPAISTLHKLSQGNIRAPSHVTFDGTFPFPVISYEERIEAIRRDC